MFFYISHHSLHVFLLPGTITCARLAQCFPRPSPGLAFTLGSPGLFLWRMTFRNQELGVTCGHCYWLLLYPGSLRVGRGRECMCVYVQIQIYIYIPFLKNFNLKHTDMGLVASLLMRSLGFSFLFFLKKSFGHAVRHVGSQFPHQGSNLQPLHWKRRVLTTGPPGRSPRLFLKKNFY